MILVCVSTEHVAILSQGQPRVSGGSAVLTLRVSTTLQKSHYM